MEYQVWTHDEYEGWKKVDCGDLTAAQREILAALRRGAEPLLTAVIPYDFSVKVKEDKLGETAKGKAKPGKGTQAEGEGEVQPGDTTAIPELHPGSGDNSPGDRVPGK